MFDVKKPCEHALTCYDNYDLALFIDNGPFRKLSGAMTKWDECDTITRSIQLYYSQFNLGYLLSEVLDSDVAVLVYNGDLDYVSNWKGAKAWTEALIWRYQNHFNAETYVNWRKDNTTEAPEGEFKNYNLLTLFRVYEAGKMVPRDQPEVAYKMMLEFMFNGRLLAK